LRSWRGIPVGYRALVVDNTAPITPPGWRAVTALQWSPSRGLVRLGGARGSCGDADRSIDPGDKLRSQANLSLK
jgi:hypothetical protein